MNIGDRVKHRINGFGGVLTARTEYMNGCRQFLVAPEKTKEDGTPLDGIWIDEQHLVLIESGVFDDPFATEPAASRGGPDRATRSTQ